MGMLHDIGKLMLIQTIAEMEAHDEFATPPDQREIDNLLTQQHGVFGSRLLKVWRLPQLHIDAALYHDALHTAPAVTKELLSVHLGNLLAKKIGYGAFDKAVWDAQAPRSAAQLQITLQELPAIEKEVLAIMLDPNTRLA